MSSRFAGATGSVLDLQGRLVGWFESIVFHINTGIQGFP